MAFIDGTVANVALPSIQVDLGATLAEAQWVVQAYKVVIDRAVDQAFVSAFRFAMVISAGMALTSAIAASLLIQGKKGNEPGKPGPRAGG
jgi:hypothetical protein